MPIDDGILSLLAYGLIFLGLIGSVVPILPGPLLIWLGALVWAWGHDFHQVGWPTLIILGFLTIAAWGSDLVLTTAFSRRAGAGWKSVGGAVIGGLVGSIVLGGFPPVLGSLLGALVGALAGILVVEYLSTRNWRQAFQASKGYMIGFLSSSILELILALLMIAIFAWQAFG